MEPTAKLDPSTETTLRSLHDIATPEPVSWMPQTWGWAVLAAALLAIFALAATRWVLRYRADAYRREALRLLDGIEGRLRPHATRQAAVNEVGLVLKRVAIAAWGRDAVGRLSGGAWARFLAEHGEPEDRGLLGKVVDDFEYRDPAILKRLPGNLGDELAADARRWIETHHV